MMVVPQPADASALPDGLEARSNLTRSQFLIWTGQRLAPGAPIYNMGWRFDIAARLDPETFRQAFTDVVMGCDALRTVIRDVDGVPQQQVLDGPAGTLEVIDVPPADLDAWIDRRVQAPMPLAERTFDASLLRQADDRWTWVLIQHHVIADALSGALIFDAVGRAYADASNGLPADTALPSFAAWAARARTTRDPDAARYWSDRFARPLRPPRLYARPPGPPAPASRRHLVPLGTSRTARLDALLQQEPFSALTQHQGRFQVFLTVLAAWVARVSAEQEFALGVATHGRRTPEEKRTAGLFMEIFPLGARLEPGETFRSLHERLADTAMDLLRHAVPGTSSAAGHGRFNVGLNYIPLTFGDFGGAPTRVAWLDHRHCDPTHALWLDVTDLEGSGAPTLALRFNESVFDEVLRDQAAGEILRLLNTLLDDPDSVVDAVPLAADHAASVALTRAAEAPLPAPPDVLAALARLLAEAPGAVAIEGDGGPLTRAELDGRAEGIASALAAAGVTAGDLVGVHLRRSPDLVAALLGVMKANAAYVPLDPAQPKARLDAIAEQAGLTLTLTERHLEPRWSGGGRRIEVDEIGPNPSAVPRTVDPDRLAYVIFTSGSTGRPKGVCVGRRALARYAHWAHEAFAGGRKKTWALHSAIGFDLTVTSIFAPLVGGGTIRVYREADAPPDLSILRVFGEDAVDVVKLTPAHLALALEDARRPERIRTLVLGGEDLSTALAQRARASLGDVGILNEYGPTEAVVGCILHAFDPERDVEPSVPIGRPAAATRVCVLDAGGNPVPDDVVGDLYVGGTERLADGYLGRKDATAEAFVPDPFAPGARMYRTGDLASVRPDGVLRFHGRADEQVKISGVRLELAEVRHAALSHPAVLTAAISLDQQRETPRLICLYSGEVSPSAFRAHLSALLRRETVPAALVQVPRIPLTPNGKVDYSALPDPDRALPETAPAPPSTEAEAVLAAIWADILGRAIGVDENFFECGGDSIAAIRIASAASRQGLAVTAVDVLRLQTVVAVAEVAARDATPEPRRRAQLDARSVARLTELFGSRAGG